jgi:hypothetical protein
METPEPTGAWVLVKAPAPRGRENSTLSYSPGRETLPPGLFYLTTILLTTPL